MPECPYCLGEGGHDLRDTNALLREHLPDFVLDEIPLIRKDWQDCPECEGSGEVTEERRRDIRAALIAETDQFLAKLKAEGRLS